MPLHDYNFQDFLKAINTISNNVDDEMWSLITGLDISLRGKLKVETKK